MHCGDTAENGDFAAHDPVDGPQFLRQVVVGSDEGGIVDVTFDGVAGLKSVGGGELLTAGSHMMWPNTFVGVPVPWWLFDVWLRRLVNLLFH